MINDFSTLTGNHPWKDSSSFWAFVLFFQDIPQKKTKLSYVRICQRIYRLMSHGSFYNINRFYLIISVLSRKRFTFSCLLPSYDVIFYIKIPSILLVLQFYRESHHVGFCIHFDLISVNCLSVCGTWFDRILCEFISPAFSFHSISGSFAATPRLGMCWEEEVKWTISF